MSLHVTAAHSLTPDPLQAPASPPSSAGTSDGSVETTAGGLPTLGPPERGACPCPESDTMTHVHRGYEEVSQPHRDSPGEQGRPKEWSRMAWNGPRWCERREGVCSGRCCAWGSWAPCCSRGSALPWARPDRGRGGPDSGTRKRNPGCEEDLGEQGVGSCQRVRPPHVSLCLLRLASEPTSGTVSSNRASSFRIWF